MKQMILPGCLFIGIMFMMGMLVGRSFYQSGYKDKYMETGYLQGRRDGAQHELGTAMKLKNMATPTPFPTPNYLTYDITSINN